MDWYFGKWKKAMCRQIEPENSAICSPFTQTACQACSPLLAFLPSFGMFHLVGEQDSVLN